MATKKKNLRSTTNFKGDAAEYTGGTVQRFGKTFFEVAITEGRNKGELRLVAQAPGADDVTEAPAPEVPTDDAMPDLVSPGELAIIIAEHADVVGEDGTAEAPREEQPVAKKAKAKKAKAKKRVTSKADPNGMLARAAEKFLSGKQPSRGTKVSTNPSATRHHQLEPGRTLTRMFKGAEIRVEITEHGFEWDGRVFKSISACAKAITGYGISGPVFFGLDVDGGK